MCTGCLLNEKQKQQAIESASKKAKDHAIGIQKMVVVYWSDETTVSYMEAEAAKTIGIIPVKFVSHLQETSNG